MRAAETLDGVLALCGVALLSWACSSTPDPVSLVNAIPPQCYQSASDLMVITHGAMGCHPDAGPCELRKARNDAIDALAACLKAAP